MCGTQIPGGSACPHCVNLPPAPLPIPTQRKLISEFRIERVFQWVLALVLSLWSVACLVIAGFTILHWFAQAAAETAKINLGSELSQLSGVWLSVAGPLFVLWFISARATKD